MEHSVVVAHRPLTPMVLVQFRLLLPKLGYLFGILFCCKGQADLAHHIAPFAIW